MKKLSLALFIFTLSVAISGCDNSKSSSQSGPTVATPPAVEAPEQNPEEQAKAKIIDVLSDYYTDLAAENIEEEKYFAPELDQFFSSKSIAREKVGESLRNSFESIEDRHITFDPRTLRIQKTANGYVGEFSGKSIHKRSSDGQTVNANFSNRVGFDHDFKIISYTGLDNKQNTRGLAPARATGPSAIASTKSIAQTVLNEFKSGNFTRSGALIHPKFGFYLVGQPGAYSVPYHLTSFQEIFKKAPWLKKGTDMFTNLKEESIPTFTCEGDNYFDKQGCFIEQTTGYKRLSELMRALRQAEFEEFGPAVIAKAVSLEKLVKVEVVETKSGIAYYFGEDAGKWYLMVIDMASYSCSA